MLLLLFLAFYSGPAAIVVVLVVKENAWAENLDGRGDRTGERAVD